ncbi:MAG: cation transporter [Bacillota bacterium]
MKYLINRLTQNLVAGRDLHQQEERRRIAQIESWTSIAANIFIALIKAIFGLLTKSIALIVDAGHSLSDVLSSAVIIIGFAVAAVVVTILIKEFLYHFSIKLGDLIKSEALVSNAWRHYSDSLSFLLVF